MRSRVRNTGKQMRAAAAAAWVFLAAVFFAAGPAMAKPLLLYGMMPVYPQDIESGTYEVKARSDSTFFKIREASLIAEDGELTLRFMIPSLSYLYVYGGTAREAAAAQEDWIPRTEVEGGSVFELPVSALDKEIPCAAYSKARKRWYDRNIVVYASSLPPEALKLELPDYELIRKALRLYEEAGYAEPEESEEEEGPAGEGDAAAAGSGEAAGTESASAGPEAVTVGMKDGTYSIECNMTGGSGRASISSPTYLYVREGRAYAHLIWSSAYYDYMLIGDKQYLNQTTDGGNSTFDIPVTVMDEGMPVIADTTAMGDPVEIEYVLTFYSETIGPRGLVPQEGAKKVLAAALAVIVVGGVLNYFVKRKRQ